jgi:hypothetical protein
MTTEKINKSFSNSTECTEEREDSNSEYEYFRPFSENIHIHGSQDPLYTSSVVCK